jgi:hypothetical protein
MPAGFGKRTLQRQNQKIQKVQVFKESLAKGTLKRQYRVAVFLTLKHELINHRYFSKLSTFENEATIPYRFYYTYLNAGSR